MIHSPGFKEAIARLDQTTLWRPRLSQLSGNQPLSIPPQNGTHDRIPTPSETTKYDVVLIMAEGVRQLDPEVMPNLMRMPGTAFTNHWANSNCTHFSLFSIFFGLHPIFFERTLEGKQTSYLTRWLRELGYYSAYNSVSINWLDIDKIQNPADYDQTFILSDSHGSDSRKDVQVLEQFQSSLVHAMNQSFIR